MLINRVRVLPGIARSTLGWIRDSVTWPVVMSGSWAIGSTPRVGETVFVRYYTENGSRSFDQVKPPEPFGLLILGAGIALAAVATTPYQVLRRRAQLLKIKS